MSITRIAGQLSAQAAVPVATSTKAGDEFTSCCKIVVVVDSAWKSLLCKSASSYEIELMFWTPYITVLPNEYQQRTTNNLIEDKIFRLVLVQ